MTETALSLLVVVLGVVAIFACISALLALKRLERIETERHLRDVDVDDFIEAITDHLTYDVKFNGLDENRVAEVIRHVPSDDRRRRAYDYLERVCTNRDKEHK